MNSLIEGEKLIINFIIRNNRFLFASQTQEPQEAYLENLGKDEMQRLTDLLLKLIKYLSDWRRYVYLLGNGQLSNYVHSLSGINSSLWMLTLQLLDLIHNSPYYLPHNSCDIAM